MDAQLANVPAGGRSILLRMTLSRVIRLSKLFLTTSLAKNSVAGSRGSEMDDSLRETRDLALEANLNSKALIREFAEMKTNQREQAKETRYQLNELDKKMDNLIEHHNKQQGALWAGKKMWAGATALSSIIGGIIGAKGLSFLGLIK